MRYSSQNGVRGVCWPPSGPRSKQLSLAKLAQTLSSICVRRMWQLKLLKLGWEVTSRPPHRGSWDLNLATSMQTLWPGGTSIADASDAEAEPRVPFWPLNLLDATVRLVLVYVMSVDEDEEGIAATTKGLCEGRLKHNIAETVPLPSIADTHEMVECGVGGKVIVTIRE